MNFNQGLKGASIVLVSSILAAVSFNANASAGQSHYKTLPNRTCSR